VLCALRLCYTEAIAGIVAAAKDAIAALGELDSRHGSVPFAGHTHTRKAMPTTVHDWARGYMAALADSMESVEFAGSLMSSNPLGTGAGYGLPIATDNEYVASELGFSKVDENGIYSQLSRTKHEKILLSALGSVMYDLNRLSSDLILFTYPDLGYFVLDKSVTTGSSIMPQKTNPDILEIIRGYYGVMVGLETQAATVAHNLISGYHRDTQLAKEAVFKALDITAGSLAMMRKAILSLSVDEARCAASLSPEIFLTEKAYELVKRGVPFRTAYKQVADEYFSAGGRK
jgi:argininosuccinate lyase